MALTAQQRAQFLQAKLRALITEQWSVDPSTLTAVPFPAAAGFVAATTGVGWVLVPEKTVNADPMDSRAPGQRLLDGWLGGAVVWRHRQGLHTLNVLGDLDSPADARRNALLKSPLSLFVVVGRSVVPMQSAPYVPAPAPDAVTMLQAETIVAGGADAVIEGGVLRAEVLGLEVGRVVSAGEADDGVPRLEVGVGRHDRLAQSMMYGGAADVLVGLREAVGAVRTHRAAHRGTHPANQLSRERWMRDVLCAQPDLVGCRRLEPVASTEEPALKVSSPACAVGETVGGESMIIGCSVGVDLHAPFVVADTAAFLGGSYVHRRLVVPEGDDLPAVRLAAASMAEPIEVVTVTKNWPDFTPQ